MINQLINKFSDGGPALSDRDNLNNIVDSILLGRTLDISVATILDQNYSGRTLLVTNSANVNLTLNSIIKKGFQVNIMQLGAGTVTTVAGSGVTINSQAGFTKTAGQYALIGLFAYSDNNLILFGSGQA